MGSQKFSLRKNPCQLLNNTWDMAQAKGRIELGESRTKNKTTTLMVAQEVVGGMLKGSIKQGKVE